MAESGVLQPVAELTAPPAKSAAPKLEFTLLVLMDIIVGHLEGVLQPLPVDPLRQLEVLVVLEEGRGLAVHGLPLCFGILARR